MPESSYRVVALPGEGIGPEVVEASVKVLQHLAKLEGFSLVVEYGSIGQLAFNEEGKFFPDSTAQLCEGADGIMFGSASHGGILELRRRFDFFINLRPVRPLAALLDKSSLQPHKIQEVDILFVRELVSRVYFGRSGTNGR